jgi:hypothetical protein
MVSMYSGVCAQLAPPMREDTLHLTLQDAEKPIPPEEFFAACLEVPGKYSRCRYHPG